MNPGSGTGITRSEEDLRLRREELFRQFNDIASPADALRLQLAMVEEIKLAEAVINVDKSSPEYDHRQLIRRMGDAVAWSSLHPYAIRQLYAGAGAPPNLSNQTGLDLTLEAAQECTAKGVFVVICDITCCLGTGDVVAITDRERPLLIECGNPRYAKTPRKKRQMQRASAASQQLSTGMAQWPDRSTPTVTLAIDTPVEHIFEAVERAIQTAMRSGHGVERPSADQEVFALRTDTTDDPSVCDSLGSGLGGLRAFGLTELHDRRPSPRVAPPHVWPIGADCRQAVIEGDVLVGHVVNIDAFNGPAEGDIRLLGAQKAQEAIWIKAESGEEAFLLQPGLIEELFGNYQTVHSTIQTMLDTVGRKGVLPPDTVSPESREERALSDDELDAIPQHLLDDARQRAERLATNERPPDGETEN
jgi:hypothetical protein